jgi:hypothetical protein
MTAEEARAELKALRATMAYAFAHGDPCSMGPPDTAALKLLEWEQQLVAIIERRETT